MPELRYRELVNLLHCFGTDLRGEGSPALLVTNRAGKRTGAHCHPGSVFWPEALARVLRDLDVSRDDFFEWYRTGRRRTWR